MAKNDLIYNPLEDDDVKLPVYKKNGKNLVLPAFISGVKVKDVHSQRKNEDMQIITLQFEVHESAEKVEVQIYQEDENGDYNYQAPKEVVSGGAFVGERIKTADKGNIWKNLSKGSGRMNRILLESLKSLGVKIPTKKIKHDGKEIEVDVIPDLEPDLFLGIPCFVWLDTNSFTGNDGKNVTYTCISKYVKMDNVDRVEVLENTLESNNAAPSKTSDEQSPFDDMDDDLPF